MNDIRRGSLGIVPSFSFIFDCWYSQSGLFIWHHYTFKKELHARVFHVLFSRSSGFFLSSRTLKSSDKEGWTQKYPGRQKRTNSREICNSSSDEVVAVSTLLPAHLLAKHLLRRWRGKARRSRALRSTWRDVLRQLLTCFDLRIFGIWQLSLLADTD